MKNEIPIFFAINNKYASYLDIAIRSMIANASKENNYKIIVLYEDLSEKNIKTISELQNENFEIVFKEMREGLESITDRVENRFKCNFTLTIYFRLFIADMFPEYNKGIYIDSDIIVPGDISELYNIELNNNLIGACSDSSIQGIPELMNYIENAIGIKRHEYINSGVLLMNLKQLREEKFTQRFLDLLNKYHFDSVAPDQDYLNAMCNGRIMYLNESWDAMPNNERKIINEPNLIHYNLFQKPWCYDNIQYEDYFWNYAKKSPYYDNTIEFKNNYSEEQKQQDKKAFELIVSKADIIPENDITFKKVFESGEQVRV